VDVEAIVTDTNLESKQIFESHRPIEEPMSFYEEQPRWDKELQEDQETPKYKDQSKLQDVQLQVQELTYEQTPQSISPERVKPELVVYSEPLPDRFADYSLLSVEEKVKHYWMIGKEDIYAMVEAYFKRIGHSIYFGEEYDEAKELEIAYKSSLIDERSELIAVEMLVDGISPESYSLLSVASKAKYFEFDMTDNNYNLNLYKAVMWKMNQKMSSSELFEGYQEIYEAKMMNRASGM